MQARIRIVQGLLGLVGIFAASPAGAQDGGDDARERPREDGARSAALPAVRAASPSGRFGLKGQFAISSDAGLSIAHTSLGGDRGSSTTLVLRPAVDYFVIDNLSLGGFLGLDYTSTSGGSTTVFSVGPRIGYNIPFSERWSVWPKLGFSFASTSAEVEDTTVGGVDLPDRTTSNTAIAFNAFVPIMFHPVEHFFLGFGPALDTDLSGDEKATVIAGRLTIGGWF